MLSRKCFFDIKFCHLKNNLNDCGINDLRQLSFKDSEPKDYNVFIPCDDYIYSSLLKCFDNKKVEKNILWRRALTCCC